MTDLTEFLLARISEDEADAKNATPGPWHMELVIYGPPERFGPPRMSSLTKGTMAAGPIPSTALRPGRGWTAGSCGPPGFVVELA